ncbi:unnamed protein product [Bursaphelenchus okinawaensis]|uniref:Fucosyltransferase n=1 Tax=Bursaphelenchus okinawaensis TaxID=465554 RepID=A0A811K6K0_9BILA|nr:unnamed protein product [Bursaphelenchus okinawaensis]CAG9092565.1 unnamed protein product [Bursaphelenchus okinawaensis]
MKFSSNLVTSSDAMRGINFRWRTFFLAWGFVYAFFVVPYWLLPSKKYESIPFISRANRLGALNDTSNTTDDFTYRISYKGQTLVVKRILTDISMPSLKERLTPPSNGSKKRYILSESDFREGNMGGCPDFNCEVHSAPDKNVVYDAVINVKNVKTNYRVFSTQESPQNSQDFADANYNMSIGFRHDSPVSSPYGYAAELAQPRKFEDVVNIASVKNKTKGAMWLVSHCGTSSRREALVDHLKEYIDIDILGACGKPCAKGGECESTKDHHFYLAVENSICKDYITEKLWGTGFKDDVIPIVLKRSVVEAYVPPKSVIAFDDYNSIEEMGKHLQELLHDKEKFLDYFKWRENYAVIYLDGLTHDVLERPWGICQLCRLTHLDPLPEYRITDMKKHWTNTCESGVALVDRLTKTG